MTTGKKIEMLLKEKNMTQKELAQATSLTEASISRYISGERKPKLVTSQAIANALGVQLNDVLAPEDSIESKMDESIKIIARNADQLTIKQKETLIKALIKE